MSTTQNGLTILYGAGSFSPSVVETQPKGEELHVLTGQILDLLKSEGIRNLDTAEIYRGSEDEIGCHGAATSDFFIVDTKIPGGFDKPRNKDQIIAGVQASLDRLKTKQVDILYFHAPETTTPWVEQISAANELYKQGAFKRLGISNFTAQEVQEFYDTAKQNGFVLPTVYQGNYSAIARHSETTLFPTLRKLEIAFNAYSPIAGGFLAKTRAQVTGGDGRFDPATTLGKMYSGLYSKSTLLDALDTWGKIAEDAGISKAELAYRWIVHHSVLDASKGDGVIFGAHNEKRIKETIGYLRAGPLPTDIAERVNAIWASIKDDSPIDNFNSFAKAG